MDSSITSVKDHHHWAAVLLSRDKKAAEVAEITGMSVSRVAALNADPNFQRLVQVLKGKVGPDFDPSLAVTKKRELAELMVWERIVQILETTPEKLTVRELLEIQADAADRLGRTKVMKSERVSLKMDTADRLSEAIRRERELVLVKKSK